MAAWVHRVRQRRRQGTGVGPRLLVGALATCLALSSCLPSTAAAGGWSAAVSDALEECLPAADTSGVVRSVIVRHRDGGELEWYQDAGPSEHWDVGGVTTSVLSVLIGIALGEGLLKGVNQTLGEMLPSLAPEMTPEVARISLHQVLTHTAGFREEYTRGADYRGSPDWVRRILADRAADGPGRQEFAYSQAGAHLLAAILAEASGQSVLDYARQRLFDPLGIPTQPAHEPVQTHDARTESALTAYYDAGFAWPVDPQGIHDGARGLKLRAVDLAKIGSLYLDGGQWNGTQVVPAAWVAESATIQVAARGNSDAYGYLWWLTTVEDDAAIFAFGDGGQLVEVIPGRDLVVVMTAEYDQRDPLRFNRALYAVTVTDLVATCLAPHAPG